ncbi:MAG: DUF4279 domain-containing protein [Gammaproteobacteria bacterium]
MATIARTKASLRIFGDDLIPDEITELLGYQPTNCQYKGEVIVGRNTGRSRTATTGSWRLHAAESEPGNIDKQIMEIFSKLTNDLSVWEEISSKYTIDLFCGLFMNEEMEGQDISPESLLILGQRRVLIGLDIYAPDTDKIA